MLSKNDIKYIRSLELKKNRLAADAFVAEGPKLVGELLAAGVRCELIVTSDPTIDVPQNIRVEYVAQRDLERCSLLRTPQSIVGVFKQQHHALPTTDETSTQLILALDAVQDPGNLGTIIRLADWFGIRHIVCGDGCADAYNPKTVQATMGAIARVRLHCADLKEWLAHLPSGTPVYGTFLDGETLSQSRLTSRGVIVMGNEGNGISDEIKPFITHKLFIPPYPADGSPTVESLNVAIATAIVCHEFRRG